MAYKFKVNCERTEALLQTYASKKINIKEEDRQPDQETQEVQNEITIETAAQNNEILSDDSDEQNHEHINIAINVKNLEDDSAQACYRQLQIKPELEVIDEEDNIQEEDAIENEENEQEDDQNDDVENFENEQIIEAQDNEGDIIESETNDDLTENIDSNEIVYEEDEEMLETLDEDSEEISVAYIASTEENIKLREKIEMKKKRLSENPILEKQEVRKKRKAYLYNSRLDENGKFNNIEYFIILLTEHIQLTSLNHRLLL